jgi:hypothetical protein
LITLEMEDTSNRIKAYFDVEVWGIHEWKIKR